MTIRNSTVGNRIHAEIRRQTEPKQYTVCALGCALAWIRVKQNLYYPLDKQRPYYHELYSQLIHLLDCFDGIFKPECVTQTQTSNESYILSMLDEYIISSCSIIYQYDNYEIGDLHCLDTLKKIEASIKLLAEYINITFEGGIKGFLLNFNQHLKVDKRVPLLTLKPKYHKSGRPTKLELVTNNLKYRDTNAIIKHKPFKMRKPRYKRSGRPTKQEQRQHEKQIKRWKTWKENKKAKKSGTKKENGKNLS